MLKSTAPAEARAGLPPRGIQQRAQLAADPLEATLLTLFPLLIGALAGLIMLGGLALALLGRTGTIGTLPDVLLGQHSAWYLSRASAFAAYLLLWWSMALGLTITNRLARAWPGGPTAGDLHEHASLMGLGFAALHALVLLRDQYIGYTLGQVAIPFASTSYQPFWVGIGQIGFYLMALVALTSYARRRIGARAWRLVHYLSFVVFAMALAHGFFSGSDTATGWAGAIYSASGLSLAGLTIYRIARGSRRAASTAPQRTLQ